MLYQSLPATWDDAKPILEQILQQSASTVSRVSGSSRRRPDPPRDLQVVIGTLDVTVSWSAPANTGDIVGWRVYKDNESNLIDRIADKNTTQSKIKLSVSSPTAFYVSSVNAIGLESIKIQVLGTPADALGTEPNSVVSGPTTVSNALTNGGAIGQYVQGLSVKFPGEIQFDVEVASDGTAQGQIIDVLLFASAGAAGPNGYFARFDSRVGFAAGQLLRVDNGTWHNIGSQIAGSNASKLSGWHHITLRLGANGVMDIWVDGIYECTATDQTYSPTGVLYYGMELVNLSNPVLAPPQFVNRQLDQVPDGTSFGRTPASNYGVQTPSGKVTGFQVLSNPDFENGTTNYAVYDNNASGSVAISLVSDSAAPGGNGKKLKIVELAVGAGPTPGLGGFYYATALDSGTILGDGIHVGDTYIIDLVANIPTGYTLNHASNSLGTGGSFTWLSQRVGTGNWQHYIGKVIIGTSPFNGSIFPFFYLTGADGVTWYVGQLVIIDIDQTHRLGGISTVVGADGTKFGHAIGIAASGVGTIMHAGNHRTYLNSNPNWGFYGSPLSGIGVDSTNPYYRANANAPAFWTTDTQASGRQYLFYNGASSAGVLNNWDLTANAARTYLNSNPQWGFFGSPSFNVDIAGQTSSNAFRIASNGQGPWVHQWVDTSVGGGVYAGYHYASGKFYLGSNTNNTTIMDYSNRQLGVLGAPGVPLDVISAGTGIRALGAGPSVDVSDTNTSGVAGYLTSGNNTAGVVNIQNGGNIAQYISGSQIGLWGSPNAKVSGFTGGQSGFGTTGAACGLFVNDTNASGRQFSYGSGFSAGGVGNIQDVSASANRTFLNSTPQWGFYGSPSTDVDIFPGSNGLVRVHGGNPAFRVSDTQTSGRDYDLNSGNNTVGQMEVIDRTSNVMRWNLSSGGASDFAGATPTSGLITAGGGSIADTSGNLKLKNISNVVGSTSGPFTNATSYVTLTDMTTTITTKGNKVLATFECSMSFNTSAGTAFVALFRDGTQVSQDISASSVGANILFNLTVTYIDAPSAASHTYDIRWKQSAGNTLTAFGTQRQLQVVELG